MRELVTTQWGPAVLSVRTDALPPLGERLRNGLAIVRQLAVAVAPANLADDKYLIPRTPKSARSNSP
jgi:hypothetical protein